MGGRFVNARLGIDWLGGKGGVAPVQLIGKQKGNIKKRRLCKYKKVSMD